MKLRYAITLGFLASTCLLSVAAAQAPPRVAPIPPTTITTPIPQIGLDHAGDCLLIYQNSTPAPTHYFLPDPINFDDLHMTNTAPVELCAFDFGYFSPTGPTDAIFYFAANDGSDGAPAVLVAGPFLVGGLPMGVNSFHVEVPGGTLGPSVWLGIELTNPDAGPLLSNAPTVGSSHDLIYTTSFGPLSSMPGEPVYDLWLAVYASPAVQVEATTWGRVKAIHR